MTNSKQNKARANTSIMTSDKVDLTAIYQYAGEVNLNELQSLVALYQETFELRLQTLIESYKTENYNKVQSVAHNVKSNALYIGAMQLNESCQLLEESIASKPLNLYVVKTNWQNVVSELKAVLLFLVTWRSYVEMNDS